MTAKERESAKSMARTVISRRKIFDPITVSLERSVLDYEAALAELAQAGADVIDIVRESA